MAGDAHRPAARAPGRGHLVLFDLDGTLVDHDGAVARALRGWASLTALVRLLTSPMPGGEPAA